jgi:hypothetical protein
MSGRQPAPSANPAMSFVFHAGSQLRWVAEVRC